MLTKEKPIKAVKAKAKTPKKKVEKLLIKLNSPRQLVVVKALSEIVGRNKGKKKITMGKLMLDAGYSLAYSQSPERLTKNKTFQELLEQYLPDDLLTNNHSSIIDAKSIDHRTFPLAMSDEEMTEVIESVAGCVVQKIQHGDQANHIWYWTPDNTNRLNAIKEAYKIKNKYPAEQLDIKTTIKFEDLNDEELDKAINEIKPS